MGSTDLYLSHRDVIERAIASVCRRHWLSGAEAEDFASDARLHLIDDDYAVLRAYQQRSSFSTFLVTVVTNYFHDWRDKQWGKWRPSAEAVRQGSLAVRLETLVARDGLGFEEAIETLRSNHGVTAPRSELEAIAASLPARTRRMFVGDEALAGQATTASSPDSELRASEATRRARSVLHVLDEAMTGLPPQDQLIVRMRFRDNVSIANIARALGLDQKRLYPRIERLMQQLRGVLEAGGIDVTDVREALETGVLDRASAAGPAEVPHVVRPLNRNAESTAPDGRLR